MREDDDDIIRAKLSDGTVPEELLRVFPPELLRALNEALAKGDPPEMPRIGWFTRLCWRVWADWIIYPAQARALKKAGFRRTGWRKWE